MSRLVHARFPGLEAHAPAVELATLPTPVRRLEAVSRDTGADVWVKLDGETHRELGGSKLRALEFLLGESRLRGKPMLAYGPDASGWLLGLARFGPPVGVHAEFVTFPTPRTATSLHKAALLKEAAGPRLRRGRDLGEFLVRFLHGWIRVAGGAVDLAPPGGSSAVSTIGYVNAALELADQVARGQCPVPDVVVAPLGSGGLVTGLALGFAIADLSCEVLGVSVAPRIVSSKAGVIRLLLQTSWALNLSEPRMVSTTVTHGFKGTYGLPTKEGDAAAQMFRDLDGLELDPVYSAKTGAAVLDEAKRTKRRILFWHTYRRPS